MGSLATLSQFKDWLGITASAQNALLSTTILRAEAHLKTWCNRPDGWVTGAHTQRFDGEWSGKVVLAHTPVTAIASVKVYTSNSGSTTLSSTTYRLDPDLGTGILSFIDSPSVLWDQGYGGDWPIEKRTFPGGFRNVEVTYTGGYNSTAIPLDLTQLAIDTASLLWNNRGSNPAMKSETLGQYQYTRQDGAGDPFVSIRQQLDASGYVRRGVL